MSAPAPRRILVIQLRQVGDVLLDAPLVAALKDSWPEATLDFLVETYAAPAARGMPGVDEVIVTERKLGLGGTWRLGAELRARGYDLVVDAQSNQKTGIYAMLSRAPRRVGFRHPWYKLYYRLFYTHEVERDPVPKHCSQYRMDLLGPLGVPQAPPRLAFDVPAEAAEKAEAWLAENGLAKLPFVGLSPGGRVAWKSWPVEHYQALGRRLVEHGLRVLVVKGPGEEEVARKVAEAIGPEAVVEVADGYPMHAALLARAEALVLNDGGNLHLAAGVDTPTVTVYGPTDPVIWGPVDTERHRRLVAPCDCSYALDCGPPPKCVASIEVDRVARELWDLLGLDETAA